MSSQFLATPSQHPFSLAAFADRVWLATTESAIKSRWMIPLCGLAESAIVNTLNSITDGQLIIHTATRTYLFPPTPRTTLHSDMKGEIRVLKPTFWLRLAAMSDMGFSEAYMFQEIDCDDLIGVFSVFILNKDKISSMNGVLSSLIATISGKLASYRFLSNLTNSQSNISVHYDISNDMYAGFLSCDMSYSCAIFPDLDGDMPPQRSTSSSTSRDSGSQTHSPTVVSFDSGYYNSKLKAEFDTDDVLYEAQMRKMAHLCRKADIRPGHRVLEIGSGWGPLACYIVTNIPNTTVDTITLSVQQVAYVKNRVKEAGIGQTEGENPRDRIQVHLMDYRNMPAEWEGAFDRIVCVEMVEAVGQEYLKTYWKQVDWALKERTGAGVLQCITIPEGRYERYIQEADFIRKWVRFNFFPGGHLPSLEHLVTSMAAGSQGRLVIDNIGNIGPHYSRTLREWRRRFVASFDEVIAPALKQDYPYVMNGPNSASELETFKRKWIYYFAYCEIGFTARVLGNHVISFTREGYRDFGCQTYS
ncbi:cyclopropane-fatty-acyl-phospholipid synthase [Cristinia sonorae]|uniref:Cyclopropane-fatty-acyl-phospholipid synthase n=1 Tax=Cristinia sonorae TaxID=1940300 RepID=A0A8K0XS62_9AGAR|nr:cyclopropane-fatty-acyl-phospholipid synthase [Cristinia sonorae]